MSMVFIVIIIVPLDLNQIITVFIKYRNKRDVIFFNKYLTENNGLQDGVGIYVMLPASSLNQYDNMEYTNKHHKLLSNGNISHQTQIIFMCL